MTGLLLATATLLVRAALLLIILAAIAFITVLLAEQVSLIRTSTQKENRHDRTHH
ncbi:hypothetical protein [Brachybacterium massiliense]|uniref:hypothetical protein n=1 Tax=Brachybacterium massiliense TaxID=1755098 RepID=UPI00148293C3|nr:hypothetical protein [Brachybacterium massiliense]